MRGRPPDGASTLGGRAFFSEAARIFALTVVALVAGCAGSGTSAPAVFDNAPDPYHYHCDAACRRGLGG
jgi:hypothetical protein